MGSAAHFHEEVSFPPAFGEFGPPCVYLGAFYLLLRLPIYRYSSTANARSSPPLPSFSLGRILGIFDEFQTLRNLGVLRS